MKLLLDMGVARRTAALLRESGLDCIHIGELGQPRMADVDIISMADEQQRAVVTLDADFSALLALSGASSPSVVHVRIQGLDHAAMAHLIQRVLTLLGDDLTQGCIASVSESGVRVRRLPVLPADR